MTKKAEKWQGLIRGVYSRAGPVADSDHQISGGGSTSPGSATEGPLQGLCHGRLIHFFKYCQLGVLVGESLYTLFASLTYAYHYLMTLIK